MTDPADRTSLHASFDTALAELTALRRNQAEELEAAVAKTRHAAMSAIAAMVRAQCPQARYVRFDNGAGLGGMLDRGWGYARVSGVLDAERNPMRGVTRDEALTPMERQLTNNALERQFGAVYWPDFVNSPVVDLDQFAADTRHNDEPEHRPEGNSMRIKNITLSFEDGKRVLEGYTTPGWYLSAADADADGGLWAIRPIKITPELAESIAASMSPALGGRAAGGVRSQNRHAHDAARKAKERADALAAKAAEQAEQLAQWEAAVFGEGGDDA